MNSQVVGNYPKRFRHKPGYPEFQWTLNNCQARVDNAEDILELPMYLDSQGNELHWSQAAGKKKPGPYR